MSRAAELRARLEAELLVVQLEEELVAAKQADTDPAALRDLKLRLRAARQEFRTQREGAATANPAAVQAAATVEEG